METHQDPSPTAPDWLDPMAGWEAANRWNRATLDWMATGWQQWVALMTTVPPHFLAPPTAHEDEAATRSKTTASKPRARK